MGDSMDYLTGLSDPKGRQEGGQSKARPKLGHMAGPWMVEKQATSSPGLQEEYTLSKRPMLSSRAISDF